MQRILRIFSFIFLFTLWLMLPAQTFGQITIFTTQVPASTGADGDYELGTKFTASQPALIQAIRFYKTAGETGSHTGKLFSASGTLLSSVVFTGETGSGWQTAVLPSPYLIEANTVFVVSVNVNTEYPITQNGLATSITNGFLSTVADGNNGVFNVNPGLFPNQSFNNSNYFVDVVAVTPPNSIFTTQVPSGEFNDGPYELGVKFSVSKVSTIKAIKYYKTPGETGTHIGRIWDIYGRQLGQFTFTNETASGWQTVEVTGNYEIYPENVYFVSVNSNTAYGATQNALATPVTNGIISTVADGSNGVYGSPGTFPTNSYQNSNYFRDIVVEEILNPMVPPVELSWPVNGAQIYSNSAQFSWYLPWGMGAGFHFDLLLSTDPNMATYTMYNPGSNQLYTVNGLLPGTTYYWRVRVHNIIGWVYNTSVIESFVTPAGPSVPLPVLSWPVGNPTVYTLSPTLYWYHNEPAFGLSYEIEVVQGEPAALTGTANILPTTNKFVQLNGLTPGTKYSWAIRSVSGSGASAWSTPASFTTLTVPAVVVPTPSWPLGGAVIYTTSPKLYWYLGSDGTGLTYEVELVSGTNPFTGSATYTNITSLNYQLSNLPSGTDFKWKVRSKRGTSYSNWSDAALFSTVAEVASTPPVVPHPSWPVGGATVYATTTTLRWWLGTASDGYTYEVELRAGALQASPTATGLTNPWLNVPQLLAGTTYNWAVRSLKNGVYSAWSTGEAFTTIASTPVAVTPVLSWPIGGTTIYTTTQQLSWYLNSASTGLTYNLKYSTSPAMSGATTVTNLTNSRYELTGLLPGTTYYWQVQSTDGVVSSAWATPESFVTWSGTWAVRPITGSPVDGIQLSTSAPVLSWIVPTSGDISGYEVQYSNNPEFNNATTLQSQITNLVITSGLQNTTYWRVRSKNANGDFSAYSDAASFIPASPNSVKEQSIPENFVLEQNYPNPFNPSTTIKFGVPVTGNVSLKVYDNLGNLVATLVNDVKEAGTHLVSFNASNLASGIYFYRLEAAGTSVSKKMLLLK